MEQRVMADDFRKPEQLLDDMFLVRHETANGPHHGRPEP